MSNQLQELAAPRISVVVFVRNAAATLERALASVTGPDQPPVELLVLDGGSTDGTLDIIRAYEDRISFWRSHPDGGAVYALNEGVQRARGDIIALLPADDWIEPAALHAVQQAFSQDAQLDVLSCGVRIVHFDDSGQLQEDGTFLSPQILDFNMGNIVRFPLTAGRFMRRRVYEKLGGHDPQYKIASDFDFLIRACISGLKSKVLPQLVYTYRRHAGSMTLGGNPQQVMAMMQDSIRIAEKCLEAREASAADRRALVGMHGRASARLAGMLLARGSSGEAARIIVRAIKRNWLWPIGVPFWLGRRLIEGAPHAGAR